MFSHEAGNQMWRLNYTLPWVGSDSKACLVCSDTEGADKAELHSLPYACLVDREQLSPV